MKFALIHLLFVTALGLPFGAWASNCDENAKPVAEVSTSTLEILLANKISGSCSSNAQCSPGESCVRGQCEFKGGANPCSGPSDCPIGTTCTGGICM